MYISSVGWVGRLFCVSFFWGLFLSECHSVAMLHFVQATCSCGMWGAGAGGRLDPSVLGLRDEPRDARQLRRGGFVPERLSPFICSQEGDICVFEVLQSNNLSRLNQPMFQCPYFVLPSLDNFVFAIISESREPHGVGSLQGSSKVHLFR